MDNRIQSFSQVKRPLWTPDGKKWKNLSGVFWLEMLERKQSNWGTFFAFQSRILVWMGLWPLVIFGVHVWSRNNFHQHYKISFYSILLTTNTFDPFLTRWKIHRYTQLSNMNQCHDLFTILHWHASFRGGYIKVHQVQRFHQKKSMEKMMLLMVCCRSCLVLTREVPGFQFPVWASHIQSHHLKRRWRHVLEESE